MKTVRELYEQALAHSPFRLALALLLLAPIVLFGPARQANGFAFTSYFVGSLIYLWFAYERLILRNVMKDSIWAGVLGHILTRIAAVSAVMATFAFWIYCKDYFPNLLALIIEAALLVCIAVVLVNAYRMVIEHLDHRSTNEASWRRALPELSAGVHVTSALFLAAFIAVFVAGYVGVPFIAGDITTGVVGIFHELCRGMVLAVAFEIILRGILFQYLEKMIGTLCAIVALSVICGALHFIFWPDRSQFHSGYYSANVASVLIVALSMGAGLSAIFVFTRSIWPCIGAQAVWFAFERHPLTGERPVMFLLDVAGGNVPPMWTGFGLGLQGTIPFIVGGLLVLRWLAKRSKETEIVRYEGVLSPQNG